MVDSYDYVYSYCSINSCGYVDSYYDYVDLVDHDDSDYYDYYDC